MLAAISLRFKFLNAEAKKINILTCGDLYIRILRIACKFEAGGVKNCIVFWLQSAKFSATEVYYKMKM